MARRLRISIALSIVAALAALLWHHRPSLADDDYTRRPYSGGAGRKRRQRITFLTTNDLQSSVSRFAGAPNSCARYATRGYMYQIWYGEVHC